MEIIKTKIYFILILFLLFEQYKSSDNVIDNKARGKCIYMKSDSAAYNFHYLTSLLGQNR